MTKAGAVSANMPLLLFVHVARTSPLLQVLSTATNLRRLMMGNTNITGTISCKLFEEHELKTVMFSVNNLEGDLPECVLGVSVLWCVEPTACVCAYGCGQGAFVVLVCSHLPPPSSAAAAAATSTVVLHCC